MTPLNTLLLYLRRPVGKSIIFVDEFKRAVQMFCGRMTTPTRALGVLLLINMSVLVMNSEIFVTHPRQDSRTTAAV